MRITTIVGARPQFIKAAALSRILKDYPDITETIIHTGQHFDKNMSDIFFEELNISKPAYFLDINSGSHGDMTGRMLSSIEEVLIQEKPGMVLVYGDTNSTLAGALAASKLHIPVIHIEAGLRSFNRKMPEEINRILTDHVSSYLFCPTKASINNLKNEGIKKEVYHVGDIMYDATLYAINHIKNDLNIQKKLSYLPERFILMTIHRAESTVNRENFSEIIDYALNFSRNHNLKIIFPVHPRTRLLIKQLQLNDQFLLLDPLSYFETQYCLNKSKFVLTDSGGLQKEAYFHRVSCVTLRSETEWIETIECGWNKLWHHSDYQERKNIHEYGVGKTAEMIVSIIRDIA